MLLEIHPENPQRRLITKVVDQLKAGGIVLMPTDTNYGLTCDVYSKSATMQLYQFRKLSPKKPFSVLCEDLKQVSEYTYMETPAYRKIRRCLPGPYTFILKASGTMPRHFKASRKEIGVRIPDHPICQMVLEELGHPLLITSILPEDEESAQSIDPTEIHQQEKALIRCVVDAGVMPLEHSTVVDFTVSPPKVVRTGKGDPSVFETES